MPARLFVVLALALQSHALLAQTTHPSPALRGLRAVRVTANFQRGSTSGVGVPDTLSLRTQVELELRQAGITVTDSASPQLALSVTLLSRPESPCRPDSMLSWYSYRLELHQWVIVNQRPQTFAFATTWGQGGVGFSNELHITEEILLGVHQLTAALVNDFRAENPRRR